MHFAMISTRCPLEPPWTCRPLIFAGFARFLTPYATVLGAYEECNLDAGFLIPEYARARRNEVAAPGEREGRLRPPKK